MSELETFESIAELRPETDPGAVAPALARHRPRLLQFSESLPPRLLDAAAQALAEHPDVAFRVYGDEVDASLTWLPRFSHIRDLTLDLWHAISFDLLESFQNLRRLALGETASHRPSLGFVRRLPHLETLWIEGHARDFEAVRDVDTLRELSLRVPRIKTLDALRGHPRLEVIEINFGGIRDLTPLVELPSLRGLELYQVRKLDTGDLDPLGDCTSLIALSLGALRNVAHLAPLARKPARTLRYLTLERMLGLETLAHLRECEALEQLFVTEAKPSDGRLDLAAQAPALRHLVVGDHYSKEQVAKTSGAFAGETLWIRGEALRGDPERQVVDVGWRRPVREYLTLLE